MTEQTLRNPMRDKMQAGNLCIGMIVRLIRGVEVVAIAKMAGFDVLFIDLEHNGFSHETATQLALTANLAGITPLVRVAQCDAIEIGRAMDTGAMGVIVPGIDTAAQAAAAVQATKFPPLGQRSVMPCLPQLNFQPMAVLPSMQAVNAAVLLVAMIEGPVALANVDSIAAVKGVDMLLVGANDLSNALGHAGVIDHPDVRTAFGRVARACKDNEIFFGVGGLGQHPDLAKEMIAMGATYATAGADITFFTNAAIANARKLR